MKKIVSVFFFLSGLISMQAQSLVLYGTTRLGGNERNGTLFKYDLATHKETIVLTWDTATWSGANPNNALLQGADGKIYGMGAYGGASLDGILYSYDTTTNKGNIMLNFYGNSGESPQGGVIEDTSGILYGVTKNGGIYGYGTIFSYDISTGIETILYNSNGGVQQPIGTPVELSGKLYGLTATSVGQLYSYNISTSVYTVPVILSGSNGYINGGLEAGLTKASNGLLYGLIKNGGDIKDSGVLFNFDPVTNLQTVLVNFSGKYGANPTGTLVQSVKNGILYGMTTFGGAYNKGTLFGYDPVKNTLNVFINFSGTNGSYPTFAALVQDTTTGMIYGGTTGGGTYNDGVLFWFNPITDKDSVFFNFNDTDGAEPSALLVTGYPHHNINTGVSQIAGGQQNTQVFPNPTNGKCMVRITNFSESSELKIYDLTGQKVYDCTLTQAATPINIGMLAKGLYIYHIVSNSGEVIGNGKIAIQ